VISQRDLFISELFKRAKKDKSIYLISVDMGAQALDQWREELPDQFIAAGISEQNAINIAAGMSATGKKVYIYFMAAWVARCFEQIRYSCAMGENPITILGNGVALGYTPAGPAHNPTEDLGYMRSICGIEIYSPCNNQITEQLVHLTCDDPKLRYIRLERRNVPSLQNLYPEQQVNRDFVKSGVSMVKSGLADPPILSTPRVCIISSGYMLGRVCQVWENLISNGHQASVVDLWKIKPTNPELIKIILKEYDCIVTVEEQFLSSGFGSAVLETLSDANLTMKTLRLGLPDKYIFENGSRDYLIDNNGLSCDDIYQKIINFLEVL
tara:strand:- start:16291 stop:17265 length:975 start_codon:yes stop_codon:yes gene_type:complete